MEDFDITNIANIAKPTERTGIYHVLHSDLGWVNRVMKALRRQPDQKANTPAMAEDYVAEVGFYKALKDHVRLKRTEFSNIHQLIFD